jgi:hypothetical protein
MTVAEVEKLQEAAETHLHSKEYAKTAEVCGRLESLCEKLKRETERDYSDPNAYYLWGTALLELAAKEGRNDAADIQWAAVRIARAITLHDEARIAWKVQGLLEPTRLASCYYTRARALTLAGRGNNTEPDWLLGRDTDHRQQRLLRRMRAVGSYDSLALDNAYHSHFPHPRVRLFLERAQRQRGSPGGLRCIPCAGDAGSESLAKAVEERLGEFQGQGLFQLMNELDVAILAAPRGSEPISTSAWLLQVLESSQTVGRLSDGVIAGALAYELNLRDPWPVEPSTTPISDDEFLKATLPIAERVDSVHAEAASELERVLNTRFAGRAFGSIEAHRAFVSQLGALLTKVEQRLECEVCKKPSLPKATPSSKTGQFQYDHQPRRGPPHGGSSELPHLRLIPPVADDRRRRHK